MVLAALGRIGARLAPTATRAPWVRIGAGTGLAAIGIGAGTAASTGGLSGAFLGNDQQQGPMTDLLFLGLLALVLLLVVIHQ